MYKYLIEFTIVVYNCTVYKNFLVNQNLCAVTYSYYLLGEAESNDFFLH